MTWSYDRLAPLYDEDMGRSAPAGDVEFYVDQTRAVTGHVLEFGAGTGRITLPVALAGRKITAADRSLMMLRQLQHKARTLDAAALARLRLLVMDLRTRAVMDRYAAILCPYSLLTYVLDDDDLLALLRWIRSTLTPDGRFVCDLFVQHHDRLLRPDDEIIVDYERACADGSILSRDKTIIKDLSRQQNTIRRHYRHRTASGDLIDDFWTEETIRWFGQREFVALLRAAGLRIAACYGGFRGEPFRYTAPVMVFVARPGDGV